MRLAVLDVGSNTAHLVVVEGQRDGSFRVVARERENLRLADAAFPTMLLPGEAEARLTRTVDRMRALAEEHNAEALVAFATSAIREARNGLSVLARVRAATGVTVKVLPGAEEARLTYVAARTWARFSARRLLVLDIGGGSLEVAGGDSASPAFTESLPLGATRLTRRFVRSDPAREKELVDLREHALTLLGPLADRVRAEPWDVVCATSKTFRTLGDVARAAAEVATPRHELGFVGTDGRTAPRLRRATADELAGYLARTADEERVKLPGMSPLRSRNAVAGSQLAALAMQAFGLEELVLAPWALREGVILEELGARVPAPPRAGRARDPRHRGVVEFARRYAWDGPHCEHVTALALSLFDQTEALHALGAAERELLEYAALLHDVGYSVSQRSHHKHSLYLIRNADLEGFTDRELAVIANVARYHRKALPAEHHQDYVALSGDDRRVVRRLAALLRLADGLDPDHFQLVSAVTVRDLGEVVRLELVARDTPDTNVWASGRNADLFESEFARRLEPVAVEVA